MIGVLRGRFGPCFLEFVSHARVGQWVASCCESHRLREILGNPLPPIALLMVFRKTSKDIKDRATGLYYQGLGRL